MNLDLLNREDNQIEFYKECVQSCGFNMLNKISRNFATRVTTTTTTIIDHFLIDEMNHEYKLLIEDVFFSDHKYLILTKNCNTKSTVKNNVFSKTILCYDKIEKHSIWNNLEIIESFNELIPRLLSAINEKKTRLTVSNKKGSTLG